MGCHVAPGLSLCFLWEICDRAFEATRQGRPGAVGVSNQPLPGGVQRRLRRDGSDLPCNLVVNQLGDSPDANVVTVPACNSPAVASAGKVGNGRLAGKIAVRAREWRRQLVDRIVGTLHALFDVTEVAKRTVAWTDRCRSRSVRRTSSVYLLGVAPCSARWLGPGTATKGSGTPSSRLLDHVSALELDRSRRVGLDGQRAARDVVVNVLHFTDRDNLAVPRRRSASSSFRRLPRRQTNLIGQRVGSVVDRLLHAMQRGCRSRDDVGHHRTRS